MTDKEAMKLALEALEPFKRMFREVEARHEGSITEANIHCQISVSDLRKCLYAYGDLEEALAQSRSDVKQEQSEPVGEMQLSAIYEGMIVPVVPVELPVGTKLYTTPQQRTWVGLTPVEVHDIWAYNHTPQEICDAVEAKLKEKNK